MLEAPAGSAVTPGRTYVVNPYISCGRCIACRAGKPNCCVSISVLGVHQDGGMAELLSLPASNLVGAEGLSADECAAVEFLSIGSHAVRRSAATDSDNALVVGTGPIGVGIARFARLAGGAAVAIYDREEERAFAAQSITGATLLPAADVVLESVLAFTGTNGFNIVFDATGSTAAIEDGFDLVAYGGRYVLVSVVKDPITFRDPDFHRKEMTLLGPQRHGGGFRACHSGDPRRESACRPPHYPSHQPCGRRPQHSGLGD